MTTASIHTEHEHRKKVIRRGGGSDAVYGIGLFGAWVYYLRRATTSQERVQGFFQGLFWPAFLVYDLLVFLEKNGDARSRRESSTEARLEGANINPDPAGEREV